VTDRASRGITCILAWIGVLSVPAALVFGIGLPWMEQVHALEQEIQLLDERMPRYHRLLGTLPGLQTELERVSNKEEFKDFYFEAKTPALAGAELQRTVKKMVEAAGGQVTSTQLLPSPGDEQPPKVRIRTQLKGTTDVLLDVLYQIEQARPFLFVEQLSVRAAAPRRRATRTRRSRRFRRAPRSRVPEGQLTVRLDVFGYALGDAR
jgi:general secretion pathway protein M